MPLKRPTPKAVAIGACLALTSLGALLMVWPYWQAWRAGDQGSRPVVLFDFSERGLQLQLASFDPAMASLARRFGRSSLPAPVFSGQTPPPPFASDDLAPLTPAEAVQANAAVPIDNRFDRPAAPFALSGMSTQEAERALDCLTAAVYYEAAYETAAGRAAVAQVVLNRVRHPAFPKTVCGVILQGSERRTGCQFTFTCDGALTTPPDPVVWLQARSVASAALAGKVEKTVGNATHYHTIWVRPYWAPSLTKVQVIGAHIFYRWTGGWGLSGAFNGRYLGEAGDPVGLAMLYRALHKPLTATADAMLISPSVASAAGAGASLESVEAAAATAAAAPLVVETVERPPGPAPITTEKITVAGEVERPGDYAWREGMTVSEAVALAGGYTYRAKKSSVYLRKRDETEAIKRSPEGLTLSAGDSVRIAERFF